jgi:formylglycine-generating enzyme required for sulfatase activity
MTDRGEPYPDNAFGLKQMMGGVWELNQDQMIRGGDYLTNDPRELMAASYFPIRETTVPHERIGFRLALSL